jgi:hypothetical protein
MGDLGVVAAHITSAFVARTGMAPADAAKEYFRVLDALEAEAKSRRREKDAQAMFGFHSPTGQ